MQEDYGIELRLKTDNMKAELKQVAEYTKSTVKDIQKNANVEIEFEIDNNSIINFDKLDKTADRLTSKMKKFAFSLFGVRTAFTTLSRASSAYLSINDELSSKIQSAWIGLGAMLAPIIEFLANLILKFVAYLNIFIKALTGVDLIAKATAKSIKSIGTSAKKASKELASFDTITNLTQQEDMGGGIGAIENPFQNFGDLDLDTDWIDKIEEFANFLKENWQELILIIEGIITVIKIFTAEGALAQMVVGGIWLAIIGLTAVVLGIIELFREGGNETKAWTLILVGLATIVATIAVLFGGIPAIIAALVAAVGVAVLYIIKHWEKVKEFFINLWENLKTGAVNAWEYVKKTFSKVGDFFVNLWNKIKEKLTSFGTKVGEAVGSAFKAVVNSILGTIESFLNAPIKAINALIDVINAVPGINLGKISTFNFPRLATGTNYVPKDMTAVIHKGEAVVPKKFNNEKFFGQGNEEVVNKLDQLIITLENKEMNAYISAREIGQTATNYINSETRISGRSVLK